MLKWIVLCCWGGILVLLCSCQPGPTAAPTLTPAPEFEVVATPVNLPAPTNPPPASSTPTPSATPTASATIVATIVATSSPSPTATLQPGATQIAAVDGAVLVFVPAGEFQMGSLETDPGADQDEFPQHSVYLESYWIDQTVVTNAMYALFLNVEGNQIEGRATWLDAADEDALLISAEGVWRPRDGYANHPAVEVSWYGAQAYCQWAERRLPTEAEWEKAARGSDGRTYPWGQTLSCENAHYANCGGGLLPVNAKPDGVSPYGVLGLSGNVWEWVADWYAADYYAEAPDQSPIGPADGNARVLRGGAWEYDWKHIRAANRRHNGPAVTMHDYGFRCVLEMPAP